MRLIKLRAPSSVGERVSRRDAEKKWRRGGAELTARPSKSPTLHITAWSALKNGSAVKPDLFASQLLLCVKSKSLGHMHRSHAVFARAARKMSAKNPERLRNRPSGFFVFPRPWGTGDAGNTGIAACYALLQLAISAAPNSSRPSWVSAAPIAIAAAGASATIAVPGSCTNVLQP